MINNNVRELIHEIDVHMDDNRICCCDKMRDEFTAIGNLYTVTMNNYIWTK